MPALLIRLNIQKIFDDVGQQIMKRDSHIVTPPNASRAVFTTEAPSVTDEVFTTALPPAKTPAQSSQDRNF